MRHTPGHFARHRELVVDTARQHAAFTWTARLPGIPALEIGGIDVCQFAADRVSQARSLTGGRPFAL